MLAVGAFRLALESLPEYEARVAERIREVTGLRLSFDSLDARVLPEMGASIEPRHSGLRAPCANRISDAGTVSGACAFIARD